MSAICNIFKQDEFSGRTAGASWSAKGKSSERTEFAEADSNHRGHSGHRLLPHSAGQSYAALSSIPPLAAERIFARGPPDDPTAALVAIPLAVPLTMPWEETFDIGVDTRSPVDDKSYDILFCFTGKLAKLTITLGPDHIGPRRRATFRTKSTRRKTRARLTKLRGRLANLGARNSFNRRLDPMIPAPDVRFGSKADIWSATAMSALPPKADMCGALGMSALCQKRTSRLRQIMRPPTTELLHFCNRCGGPAAILSI